MDTGINDGSARFYEGAGRNGCISLSPSWSKREVLRLKANKQQQTCRCELPSLLKDRQSVHLWQDLLGALHAFIQAHWVASINH